MIGISRLYCGVAEASDPLRYGRPDADAGRGPVVVWNCTARCNLACAHCYASSTAAPSADELTADEARRLIDDLADFRVPVLLFSGGETLLREDLTDLVAHAHAAGLRTVLSTNGTLLSPQQARRLREAGLDYAGVSLDGLEATNDRFRGAAGAFRRALAGMRNGLRVGLKVGLRLTMTARNERDLDGVFDLVRREGLHRVCFYHLVPSGRGGDLRDAVLPHARTRAAIDLLLDRAAALHAAGGKVEVLTVDNHADGPYLYLRLLREDPPRAAACLEMLRRAGGNRSGSAIACVSWNGDVHPDQFWRWRVVGNVREMPFRRIWGDPAHPLLEALRDRRRHLTGRCRRCRWLDVCNGNLRARAEAASGDLWADDPACYLTDEEIAG